MPIKVTLAFVIDDPSLFTDLPLSEFVRVLREGDEPGSSAYDAVDIAEEFAVRGVRVRVERGDESAEWEVGTLATDGLASPQVNRTASSPQHDDSTADQNRTMQSPPGAPHSGVGAAPFLNLDEVREAIETAKRNDEDVRLKPATVDAMIHFLERLAGVATSAMWRHQ